MSFFRKRQIDATARVVQSQNEEHAASKIFSASVDDQLRALVREFSALRDTMWALHKLTTARAIRHNQQLRDNIKEDFMAAIDDLKTNLANLIAEATSDINALVTKIASQSNQDPAIVALSDQVKAATATLHSAFTAATNVTPPVVAPPTAVDPTTGQALPPAPPVATPPAPSPGPGATIDPVTGLPTPSGA